MADRPILFSAPMVWALLAGTKTQTRRLMKPQPDLTPELDGDVIKFYIADELFHEQKLRIKPGDRLYVREHWRTSGSLDGIAPRDLPRTAAILCNADGARAIWAGKHRQAMHMPRWASRLTLIVTDVRVERLQDISEADAVAEGCFKGKASGRVFASEVEMHLGCDEWSRARDWYADLWEAINGAGAWDVNPWVVAYTFTVHLGNIDQIGGEA